METLTLKELAPYLPYELILQVDSIYEGFTCKLVTINMSNTFVNGMTINNALEYRAKPILYPLDYLTKPITHNGETFEPWNYWDDHNRRDYLAHCACEFEYIQYLEVFIYQQLIEWHFDVFNLIPRGLAVPITEDFNPYK